MTWIKLSGIAMWSIAKNSAPVPKIDIGLGAAKHWCREISNLMVD